LALTSRLIVDVGRRNRRAIVTNGSSRASATSIACRSSTPSRTPGISPPSSLHQPVTMIDLLQRLVDPALLREHASNSSVRRLGRAVQMYQK